MTKRKVAKLFIIYFFSVVFILYFLFFFKDFTYLDLSIGLGFLANFLLCFIFLVFAKLNISTYKVCYYFILVFLIMAPYSQIISDYAPWGEYLTKSEIIETNLIISVFQITFFVSYLFSQRKILSNPLPRLDKTIKTNNKYVSYYMLFAIICFPIGVWLFGFNNLFTKNNLWDDGESFLFLIEFLVRSTPVIVLSILLNTRKSNVAIKPRLLNLKIIVLTIISILLNFPVSLSRFLSGTVYLGLIISFLKDKFWKRKLFDVMVIFSITIIFPLFTLFKRFDLIEGFQNISNFSFGNFNNVDFDSFTMIGRTVRYVNEHTFSYGKQLVSALLFFIPRSVIDIKGKPTSTLIAESQGFFFTNLSEPIMGEGFFNFGIIGVIIFAVILGYNFCKLDYMYYNSKIENTNINYVDIIFPFSLGFVVFLFRGALQPVVVRIMGFFLPLILIFIFNNLINNSKGVKNK